MVDIEMIEYIASLNQLNGRTSLTIATALVLGVLALALMPLILLAAVSRKVAENSKNHRQGLVIAQYDPPLGLSPAEMGFLYDMRCDQQEIMATLFDLEFRQILTIQDEHTVKVVDQHKYNSLKEFEKLAIRIANGTPEDATVRAKHKTIQYSLPGSGKAKTITLSLPSTGGSAEFMTQVRKELYRKGIPTGNYYVAFAQRVLFVWFLLGLLPIFTAGIGGTFNGAHYQAWSLPAVGIGVFIVGALQLGAFPAFAAVATGVVWVWTKVAGRYWINTKSARKIWPEIEGYRRFLETVDLDNIQFESTSQHNPVTETLPYAMIFGLDTKWQKRLEYRAPAGE